MVLVFSWGVSCFPSCCFHFFSSLSRVFTSLCVLLTLSGHLFCSRCLCVAPHVYFSRLFEFLPVFSEILLCTLFSFYISLQFLSFVACILGFWDFLDVGHFCNLPVFVCLVCLGLYCVNHNINTGFLCFRENWRWHFKLLSIVSLKVPSAIQIFKLWISNMFEISVTYEIICAEHQVLHLC